MHVCLLSKFGQSSNLLYSGTRLGLEQNNIEYLDIDISLERHEESPHWISIPTLIPKTPKKEDGEIITKITQFKPDVLLLLQYAGIPFLIDNGEKIKEIIGTNGKIGFWFVDLADEIHENAILGEYISHLFLSNNGQLVEYKNKWKLEHACFMPQGCYLSDEFKINKIFKQDIVFLGRRQREDIRYNERNLLLDSFKKTVGLTEFDQTINLNETIELYKETKIILGSSWRNDIDLYSSDRIFNVLGAGGFYLCSYFPGIERLFENHRHLVWFKTQEEGLELARYYLSHNDKREKIAYNGYMLVKEKHTYKERVKNIFDIFSKKTDQFSGYVNT